MNGLMGGPLLVWGLSPSL